MPLLLLTFFFCSPPPPLTELSSVLGPFGSWHLVLPVAVCSLEYYDNINKCIAHLLYYIVFFFPDCINNIYFT